MAAPAGSVCGARTPPGARACSRQRSRTPPAPPVPPIPPPQLRGARHRLWPPPELARLHLHRARWHALVRPPASRAAVRRLPKPPAERGGRTSAPPALASHRAAPRVLKPPCRAAAPPPAPALPRCSLGLGQIPEGRPLLLVGNHQTLALDLGESLLRGGWAAWMGDGTGGPTPLLCGLRLPRSRCCPPRNGAGALRRGPWPTPHPPAPPPHLAPSAPVQAC